MPRVLNEGSIVGISEDTFFHHDRIFRELKKQQSALANSVKAAKKAALDDGLDYEDYKWVNRQQAKTVEQQRISHNNRTAYLRFFKMPQGAQLAPIAEIKDEIGLTEEERKAKWEDEGYVAGVTGQNRDQCPHEDPNSLGARTWMAGYDRGQAKLAKGIRQKPKDPAPAADAAPAAEKKPAAEGKITPKPEPEVATAKARRAGKKPGVTYWHHAGIGKVYEIDSSTVAPEGSVSITREEYEKLAAEYKAKEDADWDVVAKKEGADADAATDGDDDGGEPPAPGNG